MLRHAAFSAGRPRGFAMARRTNRQHSGNFLDEIKDAQTVEEVRDVKDISQHEQWWMKMVFTYQGRGMWSFIFSCDFIFRRSPTFDIPRTFKFVRGSRCELEVGITLRGDVLRCWFPNGSKTETRSFRSTCKSVPEDITTQSYDNFELALWSEPWPSIHKFQSISTVDDLRKIKLPEKNKRSHCLPMSRLVMQIDLEEMEMICTSCEALCA